MNKNVLKKFAIESRQELMEKVANKINKYFIDEEFNVNQSGEVYVLVNDKYTLRLTKSEYENRQLLVKRIKEITLEQVIEEAAYTWFNRIIAIRYMEIHDYLPLTKDNQSLGVRVLSSKDNTPNPEIMKISNLINHDLDIEFNKEYYGTIQDDNKRFEYILLLVCKKLGKVIPQVFDGVTDYIDILIPDNLLNDSGYVTKLLKEVSEDNFEQVEIIGWLYQYYNQTEKDRVISAKKAYKKNEIPFATQLFTPDWIVKYMVENSLGKFWIEHGGNESLTNKWKYYINTEYQKNNKIDPIEIKCIDPCCGSGHILVYMFEVLFQIYESYGYSKKDIPEAIIKYNLYGLDIDDRAGQLSILSIILKAREYDKDIFKKNIIKDMNVMSIQESNSINNDILDFLKSNFDDTEMIDYIYEKFYDAKEIGSLAILEKKNYIRLKEYIDNLNEKELNIFDIEKLKTVNKKIKPMVEIAQILSNKYEVVVTNPPYLNNSLMSNVMKNYLQKNFLNFKTDLFSAFFKQMFNMTKSKGKIGTISPYVWMYIKSYEELRKYIINEKSISSLVQLEYNSFDVACVPVATYIFENEYNDKNGIYINLAKFPGSEIQKEKTLYAINNTCDYKYEINSNMFNNVPDYIIAYWFNENYFNIFKNSKPLINFGEPKQGLATGENKRFLRLWYEVDILKTLLNSDSVDMSKNSNAKWYPYNKGGEFRKWYGNNDFVINWENDGKELKNYNGSVLRNIDYYFREAISWSKISNSTIAFRYKPYGHIFDVAGTSIYSNHDMLIYLLALNNSIVISSLLKSLSPTMNYEVGQIASIPVIKIEDKDKIKYIEKLTNENIALEKKDWDNFETSWNYKRHPLLCYNNNIISDSMEELENEWNNNFNHLKNNEENLNDIFIEAYNLNEEFCNIMPEKYITVNRVNKEREIKSFISYFIGCIFGRYSLDEDGLIYAGGEFDKNKYKTFEVDIDNIIPLTEDNYFENDIVSRFKKFIEIVYGKETLYENLEFIAETIGKKNGENSEEAIRRYFINDFYNDHIKIYQKRPIYWLFDSGKKNGFKCLIYMHRYNEGLVSKIRLDYLHRIQNTYEKELKDISEKLNGDVDLISKRELSKRQADISAKLQEINEYDEKIAHIADQKIKIDLDDGVAVNYAKFSVKNPKTGKEESILAKIK